MRNLNKGIVMEINQSKAVVLTPDGQFLDYKYKGKPPEIGFEIEFPKVQVSWGYRSLLTVAAILAIFIIPLLTLQPLLNPVVMAYVTVDINPSIELAIDKKEKVIYTNPLNAKGEQLINKINLDNLPLDQALELITEEAIREKYISSDRENTVVISYGSLNQVDKLHENLNEQEKNDFSANLLRQAQLEEKVKEVVSRNQQKASVEIVNVSMELRDKAMEIGLSSGKYAVMLEANDRGLELSVETIKDKGIVYAINEAGGNPGHIIEYLHKDKYIASSNTPSTSLPLDEAKDKLGEQGSSSRDNQEDIKITTEMKRDIELIKELGKDAIDNLPAETKSKLAELTKNMTKVDGNLIDYLADRIPKDILDEIAKRVEDSKVIIEKEVIIEEEIGTDQEVQKDN